MEPRCEPDTWSDVLVLTDEPDAARRARAFVEQRLALVAALSSTWGVEPVQGGGKVVWAELTPDASDRQEAPDVDLDAFLAAWPDDEPAQPEHTVRLGAVPTDLLLDAKRHIDSVVRELQFELAAQAPTPGGSSLAARHAS